MRNEYKDKGLMLTIAMLTPMLPGCGGTDASSEPTSPSPVTLTAACTEAAAQGLLRAALPATDVLGAAVAAVRLVPAAADVPQYCEIDVNVVTAGNADTKFRLGLPTSWNEKLYFVGGGGFAGTINSLSAGLARGYATVTTNQGHVASIGSNGQRLLEWRPPGSGRPSARGEGL